MCIFDIASNSIEMKKCIALVVSAFILTGFINAQELTSKKGEPYLPEKGDWALGIDATPFFVYLGNMFNGKQHNNSPTWNYADQGLSVYGKYFKSENLAFRARLRFLGINNRTDLKYVVNDDPSANPLTTVEDAWVHSGFEVALGFGLEKRRGKTRLQGFYGAEITVQYGTSSDEYTYGNALSTSNTAPSFSDFGDNVLPGTTARVIERDYGNSFSVGLRPFIGAEYFFLPKMSIAGEFGINLAVSSQSPITVRAEIWDITEGEVNEFEYNENRSGVSVFNIDNNNLSGALRLMLHF